LVPVRAHKPERQLGAYGDTIQIADDFDAPLSDALLDLFDGGIKRTARKR
jgi:hypothetical protein